VGLLASSHGGLFSLLFFFTYLSYMSIGYVIREGVSGFQRAKLAAVGSILTIMFSLLLLGIFYIISFNTERILDVLRSRVEMEAFLAEPVSPQRVGDLRRVLSTIDGVEKITFVSKEEAEKLFKQEFGEDINSVLDFNPLPPSFKIALKENARTTDRAEMITKKIKSLQGIEDVIYRKDMLEFLDQRSRSLYLIALALGSLIGIAAIFLVSNTIRLAIYSKRKIIQAMKLVGASRSFVRAPFLIEGILQGTIGGLFATGLLFYIITFATGLISKELAEFITVDAPFYLVIILLGAILGLLGSTISVRRFISDSIVH